MGSPPEKAPPLLWYRLPCGEKHHFLVKSEFCMIYYIRQEGCDGIGWRSILTNVGKEEEPS